MTRSYLVYTSIEGVAFRQAPGGIPEEIGDHLVEGAVGDPNGDTVAWLEDDGHGGADLVMADVATRKQVSRLSLDIDLDEALTWRDPMLRSVDGDLVTYRIGPRSFTYRAGEPDPAEITRDGEVLVDAHATQQAANRTRRRRLLPVRARSRGSTRVEWHTGQFSPDGSSFALLGYDGEVVMADPASGRLAAAPIVSGGAVDLGWADEDHLMVLVDTRSDSLAMLRGDVVGAARFRPDRAAPWRLTSPASCRSRSADRLSLDSAGTAYADKLKGRRARRGRGHHATLRTDRNTHARPHALDHVARRPPQRRNRRARRPRQDHAGRRDAVAVRGVRRAPARRRAGDGLR